MILGKANMHELAFGATSANEAFGVVVNPAAPDRIPGGSSGGSGAAVAADLCIAAIGTDTGGSLRLPASLCGVSGLRPTYGAVSNRGVQPVSVSLDTVGPLARAVTDMAAVLEAIGVSGSFPLTGEDRVTGMRVGVVDSLVERSDPAVASAVRTVTHVLEDLGASLSYAELPGWEAAVEACGKLIKAEGLDIYREALATRPELLEAGTRRRLALAAEPHRGGCGRAARGSAHGGQAPWRMRSPVWTSCSSRRSRSRRPPRWGRHRRDDRDRRALHASPELRPRSRFVDPLRGAARRCSGRRPAGRCAGAGRSRASRRRRRSGGDRLAPPPLRVTVRPAPA